MTKYISKYAGKIAPYVPMVIKDNWITILTVIFIAWFSYTSVLLINTAREAKRAGKTAQHLAIENKHRIKDNQQRIADIQQQRIRSCQLNYQSIFDSLRPLFPPPNKRTPRDEANLHKFKKIIKEKKRGCSKQVLKKPHKGSAK